MKRVLSNHFRVWGLNFEVSMMWNLGIFLFVFPEKKRKEEKMEIEKE